MNSMVNRVETGLREFPAIGPGERLRSARLARDMDLQQVAAELHLTVETVNSLEHDDYDAMPARVFVRGYLKNYARLVGLPEDTIVQMFDDRVPQPEQAPALRRTTSVAAGISTPGGGGLVRMVTWIIVLGSIALVVLWWKGYLSDLDPVIGGEPAPAVSSGISEGELAPLPDLDGPGEISLPNLNGGSNVEQPETRMQQGEGGDTPTDARTLPESAVLPAPSEPSFVPLPSANDAGSEGLLPLPPQSALPDPASTTNGSVVATASPAGSSSTPIAAPGGIVFEFSAECWVDVRDRDRKFKLIGKMSKGTRRVLGGTPPYDVVIGNVSAVDVTVNGAAYDLRPHARGKVARFTLNPDS